MTKKEKILLKSAISGFDRYDDIYEVLQPNRLVEMTQEVQTLTFHSENGFQMRLYFCNENIVRVRYAPNGDFGRDFSYAISPDFKVENIDLQIVNQENDYLVLTKKIDIRIEKFNALMTIIDKKGNIICADSLPFEATSTLLKGTTEVKISKILGKNESYFGLGDKSCSLDLKGQKLEHWNTDSFAYQKDTDPLYRTIPFYIAQNQKNTHGIFLDNSYRSHFDFGKSQRRNLHFSADGGEMNYYFIYGENAIEVAENYTTLTGKPELPPMWALGFHQCRWSYYPDSRVREIAADFRQKQIPCDAIYLDIDYMDGYRCFTVNKEYFPDLKGLIHDIKNDGFETIVMIDPGILVDKNYHVYQEGLAKDAFCRRTSGELMIGPVWPSACVFPDYTKPEVRTWWGELYRDFYENQDISGFWNDMNEPAVFNVKRMTFPDEVRHDFDGEQSNHAKAHNIYGMQMSRATVEGLKKIKPKKRPFLLTRATFSGGQRFASVWTGDNVASWEHLRLANLQSQRFSLSGFSFCGSDIGGFAEMPTGELLVRWLQLAIFHPLMRIHSMGNHADGAAMTDENLVKQADAIDRLDQEPWAFGDDFTPHAKAAIELRYQLLPYLYTAFNQYVTHGTPIIKSAALLSQKFKNEERDFLFGESLWVSPIEKEGVKTQVVNLPEGEWFYYNDHKKYINRAEIEVDITTIPFFVKGGTVLPIAPIRQHTKEKITTMELRVFISNGGESTISTLFEDAGEGYGNRLERAFTLRKNNEHWLLKQERKGSFVPDYEHFIIRVTGLEKEVVMNIEQGFEEIILVV